MVITEQHALEWSAFLGVSIILTSRLSSQSSRTKTQAPGCLTAPGPVGPGPPAQYQSAFIIAASASWIKAFSVTARFILHHLPFTAAHGFPKAGFEFFPVAQL